MLIDYLVSALQVLAFGLIASGCVLCLWSVARDAMEAESEPARDCGDADRRASTRDEPAGPEALAGNHAGIGESQMESRSYLPVTIRYGVRQAGSIRIR